MSMLKRTTNETQLRGTTIEACGEARQSTSTIIDYYNYRDSTIVYYNY